MVSGHGKEAIKTYVCLLMYDCILKLKYLEHICMSIFSDNLSIL